MIGRRLREARGQHRATTVVIEYPRTASEYEIQALGREAVAAWPGRRLFIHPSGMRVSQ